MFAIGGGAALGIVVRVTVVYLALLVMMRVTGRRTLSDITPMDMLMMLLLSETVSPALTAGDTSLPGSLLAAAVLIALAAIASNVAFRSRRAEHLLSGTTAVLIKDGHVDAAVMRRFHITDADLDSALHQHGLLAVAAVARAFVEADGEITIIKRKDVEDGAA
jgi:uncharacterized membrane protein YcaP (DUF421 family)